MLKHSRQRDSIKAFLATRYDHPTAETVYQNVRQEYPNISLGTVYRNLALLSDIGEIQKISSMHGPDRFDFRTDPHYHFFCEKCGSVTDLTMEPMDHINLLASHDFAGEITGHMAYFYGTCPNCMEKNA
ncbi:MAG: transcriptional repressor [Roseburia sp.]